MKFKYRKINLTSPFSKQLISRPIIPISLEYKGVKVRYEALIDSGADFTILPIGLMSVLNIDIKNCRKVNFSGVGGEIINGVITKIALGIGECNYLTNVVFAEISGAIGILGQLGFFDFFKVTFDLKKKEIEVTNKH